MPGLARESHIRPMWAASVRALKKGLAGKSLSSPSSPLPTTSVQEMYRLLEDSNLRDQVEGVWTCPERGGSRGKVAMALSLACSAIMDDNPAILQEALKKGLKVFAITTPRENHEALKKAGERVFRDLCTASEAILCQMIDTKDL